MNVLPEPEDADERYIWKQVTSWRDIVSVHTMPCGIVGLKKDGTVEAVGQWAEDLKQWKNIRSLISGAGAHSHYTQAQVREDTGAEFQRSGTARADAEFVTYAAGSDRIFGVTNDGWVRWLDTRRRETEPLDRPQIGRFPEQQLSGAKEITSGNGWTAILKQDGTVTVIPDREGSGQKILEASSWENITSLASGGGHLLGLRADGSTVSCGGNERGECYVKKWKHIQAIWAHSAVSYGLRTDGLLACAGTPRVIEDNELTQLSLVDGRPKIRLVKYPDQSILSQKGTILTLEDGETSLWVKAGQLSGVTAVSYYTDAMDYIAALKQDGTVVALAGDDYSQLYFSYDWNIRP